MPVKKRTTKRRRSGAKKKGVRRQKRTRAIQSLSWKGTPFPEQLNTSFSYSSNFTLASLAGTPDTHLFSTNSLYDPDVTGTGIQPRYYDTLVGANNATQPYRSYRVYTSKITVEVINVNDSIGDRGFIGIGCFPSSVTNPTTLAEMRERADYKTKYVGIYTGRDMCKFSRSMSNKIIFGIKDMKDDEETAAIFSTSPVKEGRWAVTYFPADESSSGAVRILCKIVWRCQLFTRNDVANS